MTASLTGVFSLQEFTDLGVPMVGGRLYTYTYGTTTHKTAYTDKAGTIPHTYTSDGVGGQYIALNARGELPAPLYLASGSYDIALKTSAGSTVWTRRADPGDDSSESIRSDLASTSDAAKGAALIGVYGTSRTVQDQFDDCVNVRNFGASPSASATVNNAAFLAAAATGKPVFVPFGEYQVTGIVLTVSATFFADCQFFARLKLANSMNTHVIKTSGDVRLSLHKLGIDGNYANQSMAPNYPCGVLVPVGSLHMTECYVTNVMNHAVHTGNTDWDFNASDYAHDINISGNWIVQPTATVGDCIRVHRTKRGVVSNNHTQGGLSSIRSNYYCEELNFIGNVCQDNYGDVGVTAALSTDITISGNTCTGNGQHGIEVDGVVRGTVSGNTCSSNVKHGILLTEYGPPSGASYSGSVDGVAISYPTVMSNKDLQVSANTCANNGQSGIHLIGQARVDVKGNTLSNNNTTNAGYAGLYIVGGTLNQDDVLVAGNTFTNVGYQTQSILQANVQGQTRTGGNTHTAGTPQWQYAVRGTRSNSLMQDPTLLLSSSVATTPGSIVEDTTARTKYARQINDTNAAGNVTINCLIPAVPLTGDKYIVVRLRTPDTMTKCTLSVQLYLGAGFVTTFASSAITTLSSSWSEYKYRIPDSQKSTPFDNVKVQIDTDVALTGKINIESVECYTTTEL